MCKLCPYLTCSNYEDLDRQQKINNYRVRTVPSEATVYCDSYRTRMESVIEDELMSIDDVSIFSSWDFLHRFNLWLKMNHQSQPVGFYDSNDTQN